MRRPAKVTTRYNRTGDDDGEDDGAAAAMLAATLTMGRSLVCMIFDLPDEETTPEDVIDTKKTEREEIIAKLRALNLNVDQLVNAGGDKLLLTISLPEERILEEAQSQGYKVRLNEEKYGGAIVPFDRELYEEHEAYAKTLDECQECWALSSLQLLEITHSVVTMEPFDDGSGDTQALDPQKLIDGGKITAYFYLHYDRTRLKLINSWVVNWSHPQPFEEIREYFGEKVALFYTWLGFYNTMLWLPSIVGLMVSMTKAVYKRDDTPFHTILGVLMCLWSVLFAHLWKRLEARKRYEWDTIEFEEQEVMRIEFMKNRSTVRNTHVNEITGKIDEYWFDEGSLFPPSGRAGRCLLTFAVIFALDVFSIFFTIYVYEHAVHPQLSVEDTVTGSFVGGLLFSSLAMILDKVFDSLVGRLIEFENWATETQHEDARIIRSCLFNVVNKYFCFIFVAFVVNHVTVRGSDLSCPDWQCMPVVHMMLMVHFVATACLHIFETNALPMIIKAIRDWRNSAGLKKGVKFHKTPMEDAAEMPAFAGVFDEYSPYVFQFGYVSCLSLAFPMGCSFALITNLHQMRSQAKSLLTETQRPPYACASDIGAWQSVIDLIASLSVVSNSLLIGVTSHSLYFFYPHMTMLQRIWGVILLEHVLFCLKIFVENLIPVDSEDARKEYEFRLTKYRYHMKNTFKMAMDD